MKLKDHIAIDWCPLKTSRLTKQLWEILLRNNLTNSTSRSISRKRIVRT